MRQCPQYLADARHPTHSTWLVGVPKKGNVASKEMTASVRETIRCSDCSLVAVSKYRDGPGFNSVQASELGLLYP